MYIYFMIILFFIMIFNSAEIAFVASNKHVLKKIKERYKTYEIVYALLEKPEIYFSVILTGINLSIVSFSILASFKQNLLTSSILSTFLILLFGEIIPKTITLKKPEIFASFYAIPVKFLYYIFYPIIYVMRIMSHLFLKLLRIEEKDKDITKSEIEIILKKNFEEKILKKEEYLFLKKIISLSSKKIKDIMIPRTKIAAIEINEGVNGLFKLYCEKRFTKIPVYKDNIDNIIGIVNIREVIRERNKKLSDLIIKPLFLSEDKTCDEAIMELVKNDIKTAIIVDQFGGTAGFIKLDDIFINFLSETLIQEKQRKGTFILKGDTILNTIGINSDESISYYIINHIKKIPEEGEEFSIDDYEFKIIDATDREIRKVMIKIK